MEIHKRCDTESINIYETIFVRNEWIIGIQNLSPIEGGKVARLKMIQVPTDTLFIFNTRLLEKHQLNLTQNSNSHCIYKEFQNPRSLLRGLHTMVYSRQNLRHKKSITCSTNTKNVLHFCDVATEVWVKKGHEGSTLTCSPLCYIFSR